MINPNGCQKLFAVIGTAPFADLKTFVLRQAVIQIGPETDLAKRTLTMLLRYGVYEWCRDATQNDVKTLIHFFHDKIEPVILVGSLFIGPVGVAFGLLETFLYVCEGNWRAAAFSLLFCIPGLKQLKCMKKFVATLKTMPFYSNIERIIFNSGQEIERFLTNLSSKINNTAVKNGYKELHMSLNPTITPRYKSIDIKKKYDVENKCIQITQDSRFGGLTGILGRPQL